LSFQALVSEKTIEFQTYMKKQIDAILGAMKTNKNTAVADKQRKETFK